MTAQGFNKVGPKFTEPTRPMFETEFKNKNVSLPLEVMTPGIHRIDEGLED